MDVYSLKQVSVETGSIQGKWSALFLVGLGHGSWSVMTIQLSVGFCLHFSKASFVCNLLICNWNHNL